MKKANKRSVYAQLSASSISLEDRQSEDYYATHPSVVESLLKKLREDNIKLSKNILEPAVGGGHIAEVLKRHHYQVTCQDLIDRGYPNTIIANFLGANLLDGGGCDFFDGDILTNPPYYCATEFVIKAIEKIPKNHLVIMLLKIQFLESDERKDFFKNYPPKYIYVYSDRAICAKNGEFEKYKSSAQLFAWYIWEKGIKTETTLRWIM